MEILRFKDEEFNLESFIHYYNDNIEELLSRVSPLCIKGLFNRQRLHGCNCV